MLQQYIQQVQQNLVKQRSDYESSLIEYLIDHLAIVSTQVSLSDRPLVHNFKASMSLALLDAFFDDNNSEDFQTDIEQLWKQVSFEVDQQIKQGRAQAA